MQFDPDIRMSLSELPEQFFLEPSAEDRTDLDNVKLIAIPERPENRTGEGAGAGPDLEHALRSGTIRNRPGHGLGENVG